MHHAWVNLIAAIICTIAAAGNWVVVGMKMFGK